MVAWRRHVLFFALLGLLSACANSDFGEVNPVLVTDGIHDWIGRYRSAKPVPPSKFEYTDDEHALRDNAYPLIEHRTIASNGIRSPVSTGSFVSI